MPVVYLILLIVSFVAARSHFPLTTIPVLVGIFIVIVDVIIQIIRKSMKRTHLAVLLSSLALMILSVGYAYVWCLWPGAFGIAVFGIACGLGATIYWLRSKQPINLRFVVINVVLVALTVFTFMKPSSFYCLRNNMSKESPDAPVFQVHNLAWYLYNEGEKDTAKKLLLNNQENINAKLYYLRSQNSQDWFYLETFGFDSSVTADALTQINGPGWSYFESLIPEDYKLEEQKIEQYRKLNLQPLQ